MSIIRGVAWVFAGTILTQLINFLTLPYISRQYDETAISSLGIITSVLTLFLILSSFRLEFFIVKKEEKLVNDFSQSLLLLTAVAAIPYALFLQGYLIYKGVNISWYSYLILFIYLIGAFWQNVISFTITKSGRFHQIAIFKVARATLLLIMMYFLNSLEIFGIICSLAFSVLIPLFFYFYYYPLEISGMFSNLNIKIKLLSDQLFENYHAAIQAILNVVNLQFFVFYVIAFESQKIIASYFFMEKIVSAPLNLLASSLRQVIYKYFVDNSDNKQILLKILLITQIFLLSAAVPMGLMICFFSGDLIDFVLGGGWSEVSLLLNSYVLIVVMQIINIPSTSLYLAINKVNVIAHFEKIDLLIKVLLAFFSIVSELSIYEFLSAASIYVAIYYSLVSAFLYHYLIKGDF